MAAACQLWPGKTHTVIRTDLRMRAGMDTVQRKAEAVRVSHAVAGMKMTTLSAQLILTRRVAHMETLPLMILTTAEHIMAGMQRSHSEPRQQVP